MSQNTQHKSVEHPNEAYDQSSIGAEQIDYAYQNLPGANATLNADGELETPSNSGHVGFIDYYISKFDAFARGRLPNKYHVAFYGPYVEQALLIMARNSLHDKYESSTRKTFMGQPATYDMFQKWVEMFYDQNSSCLNMYWAASNVRIPPPTADIEDMPMDSVKGMVFPVVKGINTGRANELSITVVDDPYMMWYQFFNALFNTQFTPLVLKPTSTFHKINIAINEYMEMTTQNSSHTDLTIGQMFEFNTCVLKSAPSVDLTFENPAAAKYTLSFVYPNAFQGTFKTRNRYMIDYTTLGDKQAITPQKDTKWGDMSSAYGDYKLDTKGRTAFEMDKFDKGTPDTYAAYRLSSLSKDTADGIEVWPSNITAIHRYEHAKKTVGWNGITWQSITAEKK